MAIFTDRIHRLIYYPLSLP